MVVKGRECAFAFQLVLTVQTSGLIFNSCGVGSRSNVLASASVRSDNRNRV